MTPNKTWLGWLGIALVAGAAQAQFVVVQPLWVPVAPAPVVRYYLPATSARAVQYYVPAVPAPAVRHYLAPAGVPQRIERYYFDPQSDGLRRYVPPKEDAAPVAVGGVIIREYFYPAGVLTPSQSKTAPSEKPAEPAAPPKLKVPTPEEAIGSKAKPAEKEAPKSETKKPEATKSGSGP